MPTPKPDPMTILRLTPMSDGEPDTETGAAEALRQQARLLHHRAEQARVEQDQRPIREHATGSPETFGPSLAMNLALKTAAHSKTGDVRSTFSSNNAMHQYRGPVIGMRQQILLSTMARGEPLPTNFENYSAAMIVGLFRGMVRTGYFTEGGASDVYGTVAGLVQKDAQASRTAHQRKHGLDA